MGTWGRGAFENDDAADWAAELDDCSPEAREAYVISTLREALHACDTDDYLEVTEGSEAIAAAAVVAASLLGAEELAEGSSAPRLFERGERLSFPPSAAALAVLALDCVLGEDSEWRELWAESGDEGVGDGSAISLVDSLRERLRSVPQ